MLTAALGSWQDTNCNFHFIEKKATSQMTSIAPFLHMSMGWIQRLTSEKENLVEAIGCFSQD